MVTAIQQVPEAAGLAAALATVFGGRVELREREPNPYSSSFPTEIVTCRVEDGGERRLFCKYGIPGGHGGCGYQGGVGYEAAVYERVLRPLGVSTPWLYGACTEPRTRETWLFLEHLEGSLRLSKLPDPREICRAARWIGAFQQAAERLVGSTATALMEAYDAEFYLGWARRTPLLAQALERPPGWLRPLCGRAEELLGPLLSAPRTVIHGEYYPQNILVRDGVVHPVDWESAALAAGEIDLAALTEQWHPELVRRCEAEYRRARWPRGAPAAWERVLAAARLYLHFRWLGDSPVATAHPEARWRFEALRAAGEQAGVV